jgi:hypothetical protein
MSAAVKKQTSDRV